MNSKESLLAIFTNGQIHVSKKDYGFFINIQNLIKDRKPITSNQAKLFDKLISKYQRQLLKNKLDIPTLLNLSWTTQILESANEFLQARVFCRDKHIIIKTPFNTKFVTNFRKIDLNSFEWDKNDRHYIAPFSTYNLRLAVNFVPEYFKEVVFCDVLKEYIDKLKVYNGATIWSPTLVKIHGQYYIAGMNENLYDATKHIVLSDDPKVLFELNQYAVKIDDSIIGNNKRLEFAANYNVTIDLDYLDVMVDMLKELNIKTVFTAREIIHNKEISNEIKVSLLEQGIVCKPYNFQNNNKGGVLLKSSSGIMYSMQNIDKIITIKNSRPIKIR
jgi:hypothetical protein